ncbi:hypothetical protein H5S09_06600 [Limosilactobacillus sp. STM2_1]|uniref:Uncharacterized protein n=1 Tax=Limosilactobacillus rudii TaxID=2759755 RepID=A0A7W3YN09_9LACO|nr:hypothetical protein [Limosilactobacillus rudii]MBB1079562.1 hypothetical protein [Limosilactobacillus rudii]MBB1097608.1 hypothetical protein [Limosilactobacillus rudii]MCD7134717.1 hypothetical protein [Limosilactobacillus rudii]
MDKKTANFGSLEIVGSQTAAGVCGPNGCNIEEHRKQLEIDKKKSSGNK